MKRNREFVLFSIAFLVGCSAPDGRSEAPTWNGTVEAGPEGTIVRNPAGPLFGEQELNLEEDLVLGDTLAEEAFFYFRTTGRVDREGNLFIWDPHSYRIQVFDRNGEFLRTIGRQGEGPGEISSGTGVRLFVNEEGHLFLFDRSRLQIFDEEGSFTELIAPPTPSRSLAPVGSGAVLWRAMAFSEDGPWEEVWGTGPDGERMETLARFPSMEARAAFLDGARFTTLHPEMILVPSPEGRAFFGYPTEYRLSRVDTSGGVELTITVDAPSLTLNSHQRDLWLDHLADTGGNVDRATLAEDLAFPEPWPHFDALFPDGSGNVWVRQVPTAPSETEESTLDLFNHQGVFLYRFRLPVSNIQEIRDGFVYSRKFDYGMNCDQFIRHRILGWEEIVPTLDPPITIQ